MVNSHIAMRFFRNEKILKTLISENDNTWVGQRESIWNLIYEFGGQSPDNARSQRETTLTAIVHTYLRSLGYGAIEQPQLNETTPDILAIKSPYSCFIELKAYFGRTIVGEAEVAQLIKYYNIVHNNPAIMENFGVDTIIAPKFLLITSGHLPSMKNNSIFNGELSSLAEEKQIEFIKKKYQEIIKKMGYSRYLEGRDTRNIYKFAWEKYKKQIKYKHNIPPRVEYISRPRKLDYMIENEDGPDMIFIPANVFSRILWLSNLKKERFYFERLCKSWLSQLILDKTLIDYLGSS
jgi:Holliday junction resolvase